MFIRQVVQAGRDLIISRNQKHLLLGMNQSSLSIAFCFSLDSNKVLISCENGWHPMRSMWCLSAAVCHSYSLHYYPTLLTRMRMEVSQAHLWNSVPILHPAWGNPEHDLAPISWQLAWQEYKCSCNATLGALTILIECISNIASDHLCMLQFDFCWGVLNCWHAMSWTSIDVWLFRRAQDIIKPGEGTSYVNKYIKAWRCMFHYELRAHAIFAFPSKSLPNKVTLNQWPDFLLEVA